MSEYTRGIIDCIGYIISAIILIAIITLIIETVKEKIKKNKNEKLWIQENISQLKEELINANNNIYALELTINDLKKSVKKVIK